MNVLYHDEGDIVGRAPLHYSSEAAADNLAQRIELAAGYDSRKRTGPRFLARPQVVCLGRALHAVGRPASEDAFFLDVVQPRVVGFSPSTSLRGPVIARVSGFLMRTSPSISASQATACSHRLQ
jgi:hypothetical protein